MIYFIRGQKVILDQDLAMLYGVSTKRLNEQIRRNIERFPEDFAFQLAEDEWKLLRSQFATIEKGRGKHRKYTPYVFTEHGVAMAANILKSKKAALMSIEIVRAFIRMRQVLATQKETTKELVTLKNFVLKHSNANDREFKKIWMAIEKLSQPCGKKSQYKIGFNLD